MRPDQTAHRKPHGRKMLRINLVPFGTFYFFKAVQCRLQHRDSSVIV